MPSKLFLLASFLAITTSVRGVALDKRVTCPDGNFAPDDACCPFFKLRDDFLELFENECGEDAHEILRLSFHDAIVYSPALAEQGKFPGGGADGSMLLFPDVEPNFGANAGISDSVDTLNSKIVPNHPNVSAGDIIQFGAAIALGVCPGGPKMEFSAGRPNAKQAGPDGLVPEPQDSVDKILARFWDADHFTPDEVVALLASHSIARSDHVDPTIKGVPFDTTPFTFDTQFYLETLLKGTGFPGVGNNVGEVESPLPLSSGDDVGEIRIQSDFALARDPRTSCVWQGFINQQQKMSDAFAKAMAKVAVIGVDKSKLVDCSMAVPWPKAAAWKPATYPATKSFADIEQACADAFPSLTTDDGAVETLIPHCPPESPNCE